jgi:hypothetical protein
MVAENVLDGDGPGVGHVRIRNLQTKEIYDAPLNDPAPDLFLRWIDDANLEIWREGSGEFPKSEDLGGVHIVRRSYVFPRNSTEIYRASGNKITVPASGVSVNFYERSLPWSCVLSIETAPSPAYDTAKVEITVNGDLDCKNDRPCAGVWTQFSLSSGLREGRQTTLTSATISGIPSYNRLAQGHDGTMIRGQFLEQNAVALMEQLTQPLIEIDYSRDFFEQILKYEIPLATSATVLRSFNACLRNADVLWVRHRR